MICAVTRGVGNQIIQMVMINFLKVSKKQPVNIKYFINQIHLGKGKI